MREKSSPVFTATKDAVVKYGVGIKMLVTDPVDTVSGIPKGIFSIFNRVGDRLTTEKSEYEDGSAKALLAVSSFVARAGAHELPLVEGVELQPLKAQVKRVAAALEFLGEPLTDEEQSRLAAALGELDADKSSAAIQKTLDARVLAAVNINPESRVKVARGPAP